ncbi:MAG: hypothetical protein L0Y44_04745 [Phycisphaerales bacterium]|nr:hypothetical protein [Phycisphaerales bacterium]MCI0629945.1 hypothetical protein [Phycisphaerales bacterium]MCI0675362.1 hypothetical protein [Phycisphaerales bacterium]
MFRLADSDFLFMKFFDHWYDADDRKRKGVPTTRPDTTLRTEWIGRDRAELSPIPHPRQVEAFGLIDNVLGLARTKWPDYLPIEQPMALGWVEAFDRYYNPRRIKRLIRWSRPSKLQNKYVSSCCELGAVLGHMMRTMNHRLQWLPDWPFWESSIVDTQSGYVAPVFHWAMKKMSRTAVKSGLVNKITACLDAMG